MPERSRSGVVMFERTLHGPIRYPTGSLHQGSYARAADGMCNFAI